MLLIGVLCTPWGQSGMHYVLSWMVETQRTLNRSLSNGMMALDPMSPQQVIRLLGLSFAYGVFHAAGPGHGKAVIATYLITQRAALRQGIAMMVLASLLQGLTAIVVMSVLSGVLGWVSQDIANVVPWIEQLSFAGIALLGVMMIWRAWRSATCHTPHGAGCHCHGHALTTRGERGMQWGAIVSIGIRPCSGAVILLGVSFLMGYGYWGIVAVMVMALGTAATTSALAAFTVLSRHWARRVWQYKPTPMLHYLRHGIALCGGVIILGLGLLLMLNTHPLSTLFESAPDNAAPTHPFMPKGRM